ncbi:MAG: Bug family tripartite tricarboxylate transporter substrate binding protein, partial [Pseudomonadota bacterium]
MSQFFAERRGVLISAGASAAAAVLPGWALAQTGPYPNRPIELVVPSSAGGGTDSMARALSDVMRKHLAQPLVVVNKPGASGAIGMQDVLNSRPDGYKVCV